MGELAGRVAFITGAASGIGLALARACGGRGMRVMLADIDREALQVALRDLRALGTDCQSVVCDVSSEESLRQAAARVLEVYGGLHMLVNNAGILVVGGAGETSLETWRRALDVNVMGVVAGVEVFLPLLRAQQGDTYILNTASVGGHVGFAGVLAYSTSKHAVVGYTESLAAQLAGEGIQVAALCPGFTRSNIADTGRFAEHVDDSAKPDAGFMQAVESGMSPDVVAEHALDRLLAGDLYIFSHPGTRGEVAERWPRITAAFDASDTSKIVQADPDAQRVANKADVEDLYR